MGYSTPEGNRRRLDDLESKIGKLEALVQSLSGRDARSVAPESVRLGKTTTTSSYPTIGNTFEFVFVDVTFTETAGLQTPTITDRSANPQGVAYNIADNYIKEDTLVMVLRQRNGKFVIVRSFDCLGMIKGTLVSAIDESTATVDVENVVVMYDGNDPGDPVTVQNTFSWDADAGAVAIAAWNCEEKQWELLQVECPEEAVSASSGGGSTGDECPPFVSFCPQNQTNSNTASNFARNISLSRNFR